MGAALLVDDAADVLAATPIACALQHAVCDDIGGATHGISIAVVDGSRQLDEARKEAAEL